MHPGHDAHHNETNVFKRETLLPPSWGLMVQHADVHLRACMDGFMYVCVTIYCWKLGILLRSLPVCLFSGIIMCALVYRVEGVGNLTGLGVHVQNMSPAVLLVSASDGT